MKILLLTMIFLSVLSLIVVFNHVSIKDNSKDETVKPVATIMYTHPIGPTQTPPYQLESELIEVKE